MPKSSKKTKAERASDLLSFYTINELAESMGVTRQTVKRWVKGESQPSDENFKKIYRREYYFKKEKPVIKQPKIERTPDKVIQNDELVELPGGLELFDFLRRAQSGEINLEALKGYKFIDFEIAMQADDSGFREYSSTFYNPKKQTPDINDLSSFLYKIYRSAIDAFDSSQVQMFIMETELRS